MLPSIMQLILVGALFFLALAIPYFAYGPALDKAGFSKWWSLVMLVPFVNVAAVWVFAMTKWPRVDTK